ncbi:hypothetical protein FB451DRAFT_1217112 [Mycena latifolia]|nr:hypothetical protein FB451DRAFT_1217112 [Mycena latifolia]
MQIPYALLFAVLFSVPTFAAPVPNAQAGDEFSLEARKAKAVKAKPKAVVKPKPVVKKPVAKKPVVKAAPKKVAAKPVAKKPVAKKPAVKAAPKKVAPKPVAKKPAAVKAAPKKTTTVAKKPAAKAPAKKVTTAAKKPAAVAKKPTTAAKKPTTAAKKPTTAAKKPAAVAKKPTTAAKKPTTAAKKPTTAAKKPTTVAKKPAAKAPTKSAVKKVPTKSAAAKKPAASACAIKPAAKKTTTSKVAAAAKKPKRMLDALVRKAVIARRTWFGLIQPRLTAGNEFIGWHGTNEETAALWESSGEIVRPTTKEGQTKGRSGLDAELGAGLYISDALSVAESAAAINAKANNLKGKVCAIFAKSSVNWREARAKVQIPEVLRGNAAVKEQERQSYITNVPGKVGRTPAVLLGPLSSTKNQMMIVEQLNPNFEAQCFDIEGLDSADAQAFENAGNKVTYTSASLIRSWGITKEDADLAKATVAAIEKKCD